MAALVAKPWAHQWLGHRAGPPRPSHSPLDCDLAAGGPALGQAAGDNDTTTFTIEDQDSHLEFTKWIFI
jgi:hypothetical protein